MGLDMYLYKQYYVKNWSHTPDEEKYTITILKGGKPSPIPVDKITTVTTEEVYWRKANAIHRWFVENVQHGEDDCEEYSLEREALEELLGLVTEILEDHSKAEKLLPTQSGFFFGDTNYDEFYFEDLEHTKKELTRIMAEPEDDGWFLYNSSW